MNPTDDIDLGALIAGDKASWDRFCGRVAPLINAAVRRAFAGGRPSQDDLLDAGQEVFLRLCRDDFRLLRSFDPARARLSTWLSIIAYSAAVDWLRRKREGVALEDVPEHMAAVEPVERERLVIPPGLLTERQKLVLALLYERDMDVAEAAALLKVDPQTVRSTHHKAMLRLRAHLGASGREDGDKASAGSVKGEK